MTRRRVVSTGLLLIGFLLVLAGFEQQVIADFCIPHGPYYPAMCEPAHQVPPGGEPEEQAEHDYGCQPSYYFWCVASEGSDCGEVKGYGHVVPGYCETLIGEFENDNCMEDAWTAGIVMEYHQSACMFFEGTCQCVWVFGDYPPMTIPACDCQQM